MLKINYLNTYIKRLGEKNQTKPKEIRKKEVRY